MERKGLIIDGGGGSKGVCPPFLLWLWLMGNPRIRLRS